MQGWEKNERQLYSSNQLEKELLNVTRKSLCRNSTQLHIKQSLSKDLIQIRMDALIISVYAMEAKEGKIKIPRNTTAETSMRRERRVAEPQGRTY